MNEMQTMTSMTIIYFDVIVVVVVVVSIFVEGRSE